MANRRQEKRRKATKHKPIRRKERVTVKASKKKQLGLEPKYPSSLPFGNNNNYVYEQPEQKKCLYANRLQLAKAQSRFFRTNHRTIYTRPEHLSDPGPTGIYRSYDDISIASGR